MQTFAFRIQCSTMTFCKSDSNIAFIRGFLRINSWKAITMNNGNNFKPNGLMVTSKSLRANAISQFIKHWFKVILNINNPSWCYAIMTWSPGRHRGPYYKSGLNLISAWKSHHIPSIVLNEITYPSPNFNGCTVDVWEWISNFIPRYIMDVITYPCQG